MEKLKKSDAVQELEAMMFLFQSNVMKIFHEVRTYKKSLTFALNNELYPEMVPQKEIKLAMEEINKMLQSHHFQLMYNRPAEVLKGITYRIFKLMIRQSNIFKLLAHHLNI